MVFPIAGGNESKGYEISNSLRFNPGDSPRLTRTTGTATNETKFTYSTWIKQNVASSGQFAWLTSGSLNSGTDCFLLNFNDQKFQFVTTGALDSNVISNALFRDESAWYHFVVEVDTTQGTAANRMKFYVNGTQLTSFGTASYPSQNYTFTVSSQTAVLGAYDAGGYAGHFDGYMAETHYIDGTAYDADNFGETNDNGVWIPKKFTGSYGNNGFFLEFKQTGTSQNSSGIGADTSGNDNHFAVTNMAATDITEDTPTNNFATMLPILYNSDVVTFSEGNVKLVGSSSADGGGSWASIVPTSGKWYAEVKLPDAATTQVGFATIDTWSDARNMLGNGTFLYAQDNNTAIKLRQGGSTANASVSGGSNSYSTYSDDTIINLALDMDNGKAYFGINGTYMNSSNPANGTNSFSLHTDYTSGVTFACGLDAATAEWNFGNPSFAISSGNTDGKYGNFEYAPPSGYYALCTKRLAEFG